jgi:hypothetical protein
MWGVRSKGSRVRIGPGITTVSCTAVQLEELCSRIPLAQDNVQDVVGCWGQKSCALTHIHKQDVNTRCNGLPVVFQESGEEKAHGVAFLADTGVATHRQNVVGSFLVEAVEP